MEGTVSYIVYRSNNREAELVEIGRTEETEYQDRDLPPGVHYIYSVASVDSTDRKSGFSPIDEGWTLDPPPAEEEEEDEPAVTEEPEVEDDPVPEEEPGLPGVPGSLQVYVNYRYLILKWSPLANAERYNIYKWNEDREQWMHYASSRDNALVVRDVYKLYRENGGYFIVTGVNENGEGYASNSIYANFGLKSRTNRTWSRLASSAPMDETMISERTSRPYEGNFYRTDYFDYEYTMKQFRDFYEAEQEAFRALQGKRSGRFFRLQVPGNRKLLISGGQDD